MRGRKPKPIAQRKREGNAGKRQMPAELELPAGTGSVIKPADLPPEAAALWDEIVPILERIDVLNRVDTAGLTALCVQWARAKRARLVLAEQGMFAKGSMGQTVEHPALGVERAAHQLFLRFAENFGITPVARARIAAAASGARSMREEMDDALEIEPLEIE